MFYQLYGLETVSLRYFNVFGPRQNPRSDYAAVIPRFITAILNGEPPTIFGDGQQTRDFSHVENVIEANLAACVAGKEACGEAFNIACGGRISLLDLVKTEEHIVGYYNAGDRMKVWGKLGAFWGGFWGLFFGGLFLASPVTGPVVVLGFLATIIVAGIEKAVAWYRQQM